MDLVERTIFLAIGGGIGFILGYVVARLRAIEEKVDEVKSEVHEVDTIVKHEKDEGGFMRIPLVADVLYFIILVIVVWGALQANEAAKQTEDLVDQQLIDRCEAGESGRDIQRETVDAIFELAVGAAAREEDAPPLKESEIKQYNAYVDRVNFFRNTMYDKIKPTKECLPYVEDDNVKPPPPNAPYYRTN